uniref:Enolase N-terminal domain-containing protein n=1 Tax=Sciurus vulgaris TaxID=55149 RepID=A0A8D2ACS9_SCIVU
MSILKIHAREIFDSRGNPTVEVDLFWCKCYPGGVPCCLQSWCCGEGGAPVPPRCRLGWQL